MSKKHRRRDRYRFGEANNQPSGDASAASSGMVTNSSSSNMPGISNSLAAAEAAEYQIIKHDLIRVLILNLVFLAILLTLYYTNLHQHYLERFVSKLLHF